MNRILILMGLLGVPFVTVSAQDGSTGEYVAFKQALGETSWIASGADHPLAATAFRPIPALSSFAMDAQKQALGFSLFHDARLSRDGTVACNSCHMGMHGGTDNLKVSRGIDGKLGILNAPTIFNSAFNFRQFWDGRAFDLEEQALGPIINPVEMGHDLASVVEFVSSNTSYARQFEAIYPDGVTAANIGNAIAQHSRNMTRTDSRFNAFLSGDNAALNEQELLGWKRFQDVGCASCHNGINIGGNSYQRASNTAETLGHADEGLYGRSGLEQDRNVFKVPSLHNVALTAPYLHDGSVSSLREVVQIMGQEQAGRNLSDPDINNIVAFLHTLSSDFFAGHGPGISGRGMEGEMSRRMQQGHHGGRHGSHEGAGNHGARQQPGPTMQLGPDGERDLSVGQPRRHRMMPENSAASVQDENHGGYLQ